MAAADVKDGRSDRRHRIGERAVEGVKVESRLSHATQRARTRTPRTFPVRRGRTLEIGQEFGRSDM
jgi:hypothetical protein